MSQFIFWDTERIRLFYFPQQAERGPRASRDNRVADLVIERGKNAFLENTPALVWCDFLELGRLFFSEWGLTRRRLGEVAKVLPDLHEPIASGPA
jgi:hypothetical protein